MLFITFEQTALNILISIFDKLLITKDAIRQVLCLFVLLATKWILGAWHSSRLTDRQVLGKMYGARQSFKSACTKLNLLTCSEWLPHRGLWSNVRWINFLSKKSDTIKINGGSSAILTPKAGWFHLQSSLGLHGTASGRTVILALPPCL